MNRNASWLSLWILTQAVGFSGPIAFNVQIDTSPIVVHPAGPFSLNLQLNDGEGIGDANNTVILSKFQFDGGSPSGTATTLNGASGDLSSIVTLTDTEFLNSFSQPFAAGSLLKFHLSLTSNLDMSGIPDQFSLAILDSTGFEIPTLGPANALLIIDITAPNLTIQTFATDPALPPFAGGNPIALGPPQVTLVPEPSTWSLVGISLIIWVWRNKGAAWASQVFASLQGGSLRQRPISCSSASDVSY